MAIALGLFLATLATLAPPVAAVDISQPVHAPGTVSVVLHFEDPDTIPLTHVLLHFVCDATGAPGFTDSHDLVDGDSTLYATLHISPLSDASNGYGYLQGYQTGYGFHGGEHGYATGDTSLAGGYGYGYGYQSGDLVLLIDLHAAAFAANESCTLVVGIDAPGLAGDFESPRSDPFQPRIPPVADANPGPDSSFNKPEGAAVTLDGSESTDADHLPDPLIYDWVQDSGTPVVLSPGSDPWLATFTAPSNGDEDLVFNLTVSDGLDSNSSQVTVHVHHDNLGPTADAGDDQSAPEGATVTLDGAGSDPEDDPLDLLWTQVSGPAVALDHDDIEQPTFTVPALADGDEDAVFQLNVTDGSAFFDLDTVTVHLQKKPIAVLEVVPEELEGRAPHTVHFSVDFACFDGPCASTTLAFADGGFETDLTPGSTVEHTYETADEYTPVLRVVDGRDLEAFSPSLHISVLDAGTPYANAGPDQSVYKSAHVALDGRASYDPDNGTLAYAWAKVDGPAVTLSGANTAQPTFTATTAGTLTFRLTVTDPDGLHDADDVTVTVRDLPTGGLSETYFLHAPGCIVGGQALDLGGPGLEDHGAHSSRDPDGEGTPDITEPDHICLQPTDGIVTETLPVDPLMLLDGTDSFPSEDGEENDYAYVEGSHVSGHLGLSLLLPPNLGDVPIDDATLDVTLLDASGNELGSKTGIHVDYDGTPAFGLVTNLADSKPEAHYTSVPFGFDLDDGSLDAGDGFTLEIQVHSELVNVFLEDGHESSFTLTQGNPERNHAPHADVSGTLQVHGGDDVTLSSVVEDDDAPDLDAIDYEWYQVGGPHIDLADTHSEQLGFEAPSVDENTTYAFALQVRTGTGASQLTSNVAEVPVRVLVASGDNGGDEDANNTAPIAYAGPDLTVDEGAAVVLNGVTVDTDQEAVSADWSQVSGPSVALTQLPGSDASLTAPQVSGDRQLVFRLTATDPHSVSSSDTMVLTVRDRSGSGGSTTTTTTGSGGSGGNGGSGGSGGSGGNGGSDGSGSGGGSGSGSGGNGGSGSAGGPSTGSGPGLPGSSGFPAPVGGLLGFDLSATLRVTRVGDVNHLEWSSPGFEPMGYQVWSSNSPYVLLAINDGNRTTYDDATGTPDTVYKVTYFTGMTEAQGFFGDASKVFDWPEAQHHAAAKRTWIPGADAGLVALALVGAAALVALRRRLE